MPYQVTKPKIFACPKSNELGENIAKAYGMQLGTGLDIRKSEGE